MNEVVTIENAGNFGSINVRIRGSVYGAPEWQSITSLSDQLPIGKAVEIAMEKHYHGLAREAIKRWRT